mgnify:CR=1 FL=1
MIRLGVGEARNKAASKDLRSSITEFYFFTSPVCYRMREWR